ncbi:hypothetical protein [Tepidibacillus marianensis]|uniref:hypothetical protein n=1 Tax=Tepidibacillus marianensis TaxID=3131995 RepID=UPI0030CBAF0C
MYIEPLLAYIVARKITGKKLRSLTESGSGETFAYDFGDTIYDYRSKSYYSVTHDGTVIKVYDYKLNKHLEIKPKSPGVFIAHRLDTDDFYEIAVHNKIVLITNKKKSSTKIYYYHS